MTPIDMMAGGLVLGVLAVTVAKALSIKKPEKTPTTHLTVRMGTDPFTVIEQSPKVGTLKLAGSVFKDTEPGHFIYVEQPGFDRVELIVLTKAVICGEFIIRCRGVRHD